MKLYLGVKTFLSCILFIIIVITGLTKYHEFQLENDLRFFTFMCRIFDREKNLVEKIEPYAFCDYSPDGKVIASDPFEGKVILFDANGNSIWTLNEYIHHDLKFTPDFNYIIGLQSEIIYLEGKHTRSDCAVKYNLNKELVGKWCLKDNLKTVLVDKKIEHIPVKVNSYLGQSFKSEISHANSIYEIPDNTNSKINPAFKKGNYIVNFLGSSGLIAILDSQMKTLLWKDNCRNFLIEGHFYWLTTHDVQILPGGNMLLFANEIYPHLDTHEFKVTFDNLFKINLGIFQDIKNTNPQPQYSTLIEINPITRKVSWQYYDSPKENFFAFANGNVNKLKNSFVYSFLDHKNGGGYIQSTYSGKKIWSFSTPEKNLSGKGLGLIQVRPFTNYQYLKSRNLLD